MKSRIPARQKPAPGLLHGEPQWLRFTRRTVWLLVPKGYAKTIALCVELHLNWVAPPWRSCLVRSAQPTHYPSNPHSRVT